MSQNQPERPKLAYTVDEFLAMHPAGRGSTYEAIKRGEIPSVKQGKRVFIPAWYVNQFLKGPK